MDRRSQASFVAAFVILALIGLGQMVTIAWQYHEVGRSGGGMREAASPLMRIAAGPQNSLENEPPVLPAIPGAEPLLSLQSGEIAPGLDEESARQIREHDLITTETFRESTPVLIENILSQARELRFQGQHINALLRLREGRLIDPRHPLVLAEIASTYEQMDDPAQAKVFWQELASLGDSAGVLRELAQMRLGGGSPSRGTAGNAWTTAAAGLETDLSADEASVNPDAVIRFRDIREERNDGPEGDLFITLRLEVEGREDVQILPRSVFVLVLFYEIIDGKDIVPTSARVDHHWVSLPADWAGDDPAEVLEVDYHLDPAMLVAGGSEEEPQAGRRQYHGYIARLYYDNLLQDFSADPASLLNLFPPSNVLPTE